MLHYIHSSKIPLCYLEISWIIFISICSSLLVSPILSAYFIFSTLCQKVSWMITLTENIFTVSIYNDCYFYTDNYPLLILIEKKKEILVHYGIKVANTCATRIPLSIFCNTVVLLTYAFKVTANHRIVGFLLEFTSLDLFFFLIWSFFVS